MRRAAGEERSMALVLTEREVGEILTMDAAIRAVEQAFRALGSGQADNQPRRRVRVPKGVLHNMSAALPEAGALGIKAYASVAGTTRFLVALWDSESGVLKALIEGDRLGQMRTGAASGVATKYLAREDASVGAVIGTGWQARSQLLAICAARSLREVRAFGRDPERRRAFCEEMSRASGVDVRPAESAEEAVRGADVVVTMTTSREPVLLGRWLEPGMHVNAAGSNWANRQELDVEAVRRADLIVADQVEGAKLESGDLVAAAAAGAITWEQVGEFGEVVAGKLPGRTTDRQITLFASQGLAIQDMAAAAYVHEQARQRGLGREIPLFTPLL